MVRKTNLHLQQLLIDLFYYHRKLSLSIHSIQTYDILDMFGHNWSNNRQKGTRPRLLQTNNYIGRDLLGVYRASFLALYSSIDLFISVTHLPHPYSCFIEIEIQENLFLEFETCGSLIDIDKIYS